MFSMLPALHTHNHNQSQSHYYTPMIPSPLSSSPLRNTLSPLSPRNANVPSSPPPMDHNADELMSSPLKTSRVFPTDDRMTFQPDFGKRDEDATNFLITPPRNTHTGPRTSRESVYSKRTTKSNPLLNRGKSGDEGRETRRKLFLKRVRDVADEKRWKERGICGNAGKGDKEEEEILRCIWLQEERKRDEKKRKEALGVLDPAVEEEEAGLDEMMTEVLRDEHRESDEYLAMLEALYDPDEDALLMEIEAGYLAPRKGKATARGETDTLYGSDDEEYDEIFMDVIEEEQRLSSQQSPAPAYVDDQEMMDMS